MRAIALAIAVLLAVVDLGIASDPAPASKGLKVLPKLDAVVKAGRQRIDSRSFSLPWMVQEVSGDWLWVGDVRKGWVKRNQIVAVGDATAYYTQLIGRQPSVARAYTLRAAARRENGDLAGAIADYGTSLRLAPSAGAYAARGSAWAATQQYDRAIEDCNRAVRLDPAFATAYCNRGLAWLDKGPYKNALADFNQAIRIDSRCAQAYRGRGNVAYARHDEDQAVVDYSEAIRLDPNYSEAYRDRAGAWFDKHEFEKSTKDLSHVIRVEPNQAQTYNLRGIVWTRMKRYDQALADYSEAIRLDPKSYAMNSAAYILATCPDERYRDGKKAVALATRACETRGWQRYDPVDTLAAAYAEAGDFAKAIEYQKKALELHANPLDTKFVQSATERIALYQDRKPYRAANQ